MRGQATSPFPAKRLKYVVSLRRSRVDGSEDGRPYIGLENIESWTGKRLGVSAAVSGESSAETVEGTSLSNTFEPGDVLFGKLRPYLAKAWVAEFPGRSTTELLVMQPVEAESRFLRYVCLWRDFVDTVDASTFGSKMPRADWDFIGNMPIPVPDWPTQRAIADYLDRETARIDALIVAKERLLGLLAEKRRALITRAVTRGLDPAVPMRDSGIPWLGKIPAHWDLKRGKWLFTERAERSVDGEETLLSLRMERGLVPHNDVSEKQTRPEELIGYKRTRPGDLVVNRMRAAIGLIAHTTGGSGEPRLCGVCPVTKHICRLLRLLIHYRVAWICFSLLIERNGDRHAGLSTTLFRVVHGPLVSVAAGGRTVPDRVAHQKRERQAGRAASCDRTNHRVP